MVHGELVFVNVPIQSTPPGPLHLSTADSIVLDTAMLIYSAHHCISSDLVTKSRNGANQPTGAEVLNVYLVCERKRQRRECGRGETTS
ncbi:hypothetical protein E2C01_038475 [Portunus trituberculatus]|uniref:Uncharacterized protein n=1 Tax=Portunus trituberculatus TaxID=210409 RepID=A0A5B7FGY4_PORTR|nr:hypothetical protein [Portunus trituberculatus]